DDDPARPQPLDRALRQRDAVVHHDRVGVLDLAFELRLVGNIAGRDVGDVFKPAPLGREIVENEVSNGDAEACHLFAPGMGCVAWFRNARKGYKETRGRFRSLAPCLLASLSGIPKRVTLTSMTTPDRRQVLGALAGAALVPAAFAARPPLNDFIEFENSRP